MGRIAGAIPDAEALRAGEIDLPQRTQHGQQRREGLLQFFGGEPLQIIAPDEGRDGKVTITDLTISRNGRDRQIGTGEAGREGVSLEVVGKEAEADHLLHAVVHEGIRLGPGTRAQRSKLRDTRSIALAQELSRLG